MKPTRRSAGDPSRLNRVAARRSSLRFGRKTPGIPPSRALSAGRLAGLGAHRVPPPAVHRSAARRPSLRFGRKTPGIPPSRALSAGPPPGELAPPGELGLASLGARGFHHRLNRVASRRSSLRFGRKTPGIPPSRALSAGPPPGELASLGAHVGSTTGCSPLCCAPPIVAFRLKYTRYSSLTRLVSRAPHRPRRSRGFHHRLL